MSTLSENVTEQIRKKKTGGKIISGKYKKQLIEKSKKIDEKIQLNESIRYLTALIERMQSGDKKVSYKDISKIKAKIDKEARNNVYEAVKGIESKKFAHLLGYASHSMYYDMFKIEKNKKPSFSDLIGISILTNKSIDELIVGSALSQKDIEEFKKITDKFEIEINTEINIEDDRVTSLTDDVELTKAHLIEVAKVMYKTLRKHNCGPLFYVPDMFVHFLEYVIEDNDFISEISKKASAFAKKFKYDKNLPLLKEAEDIEAFEKYMTREQIQYIEEIIIPNNEEDKQKYYGFMKEYLFNIRNTF